MALTVLTATIAVGTSAGAGARTADDSPARLDVPRPDYHPSDLQEQRSARREAALGLLRDGSAHESPNGVVALADDKYVETTVSGVDQVFTMLVEFGDEGSGRLGTEPGPAHNEIPEPDWDVDNFTIWAPDFDTAYYDDLYFGPGDSFASFYAEQSGGAYTVDGTVSDWVRLAHNESWYGDNAVEDGFASWAFVEDTTETWYAAQLSAGRTAEEIRAELEAFDVWDRYDQDEDGIFAEPDGYLDHSQIVHAGAGEETGGGAQGADAIWSHMGYVNQSDAGLTGPILDGEPVLLGGTPIGDTGIWIGDHVVVPENVEVGVLAHEYGHDLGLPDLYNYVGQRYNGVGFWSLMSLGTYSSKEGDQVGTWPVYMGPWEKLQLGWLDYAVVGGGESAEHTLSPAAVQVDGQEQAVIVDVPDQGIELASTTPTSGTSAWWTGIEDWTTSTLTRAVDLTGVARPTLSMKAWYDIELGYDYLYVEYSRDGGATWQTVGMPLDGSSHGRWTTLRYRLPGGSPLLLRLRYETDPYVHGAGAFVDDIRVASGTTTVFADDVESGDNGWVADGFSRSDGIVEQIGDRYYLLEHRTYVGADDTLRVGPYNFARLYRGPDWVDHFAYPDGLLVWAVDETYEDNETEVHPGHGLTLPIDARPFAWTWPDGLVLANHLQVFDATFGLTGMPETVFRREIAEGYGPHQTIETVEVVVPASPGIPIFDDSDPEAYWSTDNPNSSALVAGHGAQVTVLDQTSAGTMTVSVVNP